MPRARGGVGSYRNGDLADVAEKHPRYRLPLTWLAYGIRSWTVACPRSFRMRLWRLAVIEYRAFARNRYREIRSRGASPSIIDMSTSAAAGMAIWATMKALAALDALRRRTLGDFHD